MVTFFVPLPMIKNVEEHLDSNKVLFFNLNFKVLFFDLNFPPPRLPLPPPPPSLPPPPPPSVSGLPDPVYLTISHRVLLGPLNPPRSERPL